MRSRLFGYGELPLVLLALLDEEPSHGYELMTALDRLFSPDYSASPGSVYPALTALEEEGLIDSDGDSPRRYRLTSDGERALEARRARLADIELRTGRKLRPDSSLSAELDRLSAVARAAERHLKPDAITAVLADARRRLRDMIDRCRKEVS